MLACFIQEFYLRLYYNTINRSMFNNPLSSSHTHRTYPCTRLKLALLPRISHRVILAHPNLRLLLGHDMFHKDLPRVLSLELADPARIPQFAGNAQILTAPDKRVGATSLRRGGDAVGREVVLFAAGDGDQTIPSVSTWKTKEKRKLMVGGGGAVPSMTNQSVFPRHRLRGDNALTPRNQSPAPRSKRPIQNPSVLDFRQIQDPIRLDLDLINLRRCQEDIRRFLGEGRSTQPVERTRPVNLFFGGGLQLERLVRETGLGNVGRCLVARGWRDDAGGAVCG